MGRPVNEDSAVPPRALLASFTGDPSPELYPPQVGSDQRKTARIVRLCESSTCHLAGDWSSVLDELRRLLGVDVGQTTADGEFALELTSCLEACGAAPAMMVDDEVVGNLTPERVREALARYREGR
jgi:NADH:ubiquinone oxidoreductase subunit E